MMVHSPSPGGGGKGAAVPTSFAGFNSSLNQCLTTSHSVEVKLSWSQSSKKGILYKSSTFWTIIILDKVGECTVTETKWNAFAFNILLAYHCNNLGKGKMKLTACFMCNYLQVTSIPLPDSSLTGPAYTYCMYFLSVLRTAHEN